MLTVNHPHHPHFLLFLSSTRMPWSTDGHFLVVVLVVVLVTSNKIKDNMCEFLLVLINSTKKKIQKLQPILYTGHGLACSWAINDNCSQCTM